jgi:hypothetical protein
MKSPMLRSISQLALMEYEQDLDMINYCFTITRRSMITVKENLYQGYVKSTYCFG